MYSEQYKYISKNFGGNYSNIQIRLGFTVGAEPRLVSCVQIEWSQVSPNEDDEDQDLTDLFSDSSLDLTESIISNMVRDSDWYRHSDADEFASLAIYCPALVSHPTQQEFLDKEFSFVGTILS